MSLIRELFKLRKILVLLVNEMAEISRTDMSWRTNNSRFRLILLMFMIFSVATMTMYLFILFLREKPSPPKVHVKLIFDSSYLNDLRLWHNKLDIPLLTLFTTWKENPEKAVAYNNTISNWSMLRPFVTPVIFTDDRIYWGHMYEKAWHVLPIPKQTHDIPVLKDMYLVAMSKFKSHFYAFCNGDILFNESLVDTLLAVMDSLKKSRKPVLVVGKRVNTMNVTSAEASDFMGIVKVSELRGELFGPDAEDYFITSADYPWEDVPNVVIGKRAYDNWLVLNNRKRKFRTIDASKALLAVHQTTASGNLESYKTAHIQYNAQLLGKLYKGIIYKLGFVDCAEEYLEVVNNRIFIQQRELAMKCDETLERDY